MATRASIVSAGTERQALLFGRANLLDKARARPDLVRQVLDKAMVDGLTAAWVAARGRLAASIPLGYSSSGVVAAVGPGVTTLQVGDRVACAGQGFAGHAEAAWVPANFAVRLPSSVGFDEGACATLGAIALHGIHVAGVTPGLRVGVVGLGLLGQFTVQLLAAYGCPVFGVDIHKTAAAQALELGASGVAVGGADEAGPAAKAFTGGHGLDVVIVTAASESNEPLASAAAMARRGGRVCVVGLVGMEADRRLFYEKELQLTVSKSYGAGRDDPRYQRGADYPLELSRWTVARNMEEYLRLVALGRVSASPLIRERVSLEEAPTAYKRLAEGRGGTVLITYPGSAPEGRRPPEKAPASTTLRPITMPGVGVIGAGTFARGTLLPLLARSAGIRRVSVASVRPPHAADAARRFGFDRATTDPEDVFSDPSVHAVIIATRHDQHAPLAVRALQSGKHALVEKPLALDLEQLRSVAASARAGPGVLAVDFNRRHAPLMRRLASHMAGREGPMLMTYRVSAGSLPGEHWVRDPQEGGGRALSEGCHFLDTFQFLCGATPTRVVAHGHGQAGLPPDEQFGALVEFSDGSRGLLAYTGQGPSRLPKERLEVVGGGMAAVLDNFRRLELHDGRRRRTVRTWGQDKGHGGTLDAFLASASGEGPPPVPLPELLATSLATLALGRSLASGRPVRIDLPSLSLLED